MQIVAVRLALGLVIPNGSAGWIGIGDTWELQSEDRTRLRHLGRSRRVGSDASTHLTFNLT